MEFHTTYHLDTSDLDQVLHSFAKQVYKLGVANQLTIVLVLGPREGGWIGNLELQHPWPLFCQVGVLLEDCSGWSDEHYV